MVIIAIGQLNLSVGAIGGLAAITFAGVMEVWGLPVPAGDPGRAGRGRRLRRAERRGHPRHRAERLCRDAGDAVDLQGHQYRHHRGAAVLRHPRRGEEFRQCPHRVRAVSAVRQRADRDRGRGCSCAAPCWAGSCWPPAATATRRSLSGISIGRVVVAAHVISGTLAAVAGMLAVARLQLGQPTIGDDWLIISFAAPVIGGAVLAGGHVSVVGTLLGVAVVIADQQCAGASRTSIPTPCSCSWAR